MYMLEPLVICSFILNIHSFLRLGGLMDVGIVPISNYICNISGNLPTNKWPIREFRTRSMPNADQFWSMPINADQFLFMPVNARSSRIYWCLDPALIGIDQHCMELIGIDRQWSALRAISNQCHDFNQHLSALIGIGHWLGESWELLWTAWI